jgi:hypothetical protein
MLLKTILSEWAWRVASFTLLSQQHFSAVYLGEFRNIRK